MRPPSRATRDGWAKPSSTSTASTSSIVPDPGPPPTAGVAPLVVTAEAELTPKSAKIAKLEATLRSEQYIKRSFAARLDVANIAVKAAKDDNKRLKNAGAGPGRARGGGENAAA